MIYLINIVLIFVYWGFAKLLPIAKNKKEIVFLIACSIQISLIAGTRTINTGTDTVVYFNFFQRTLYVESVRDILGSFEPFYSLLCWTVGKMGLNFLWLNTIMAALTMYFYSKAVYRMSSNVYLSMILYVFCCMFYQMMNQYRQMLAMAIVLYAISLLQYGMVRRYTVWILTAALFHYSALVALILIPLAKVDIKKRTIEIYSIVILGFPLVQRALFGIIAFTPYARYVGRSYERHMQMSTVYNLAVRVMLLIGCLFFLRKIKEHSTNCCINITYHMIFICTVIQMMTTQSSLFGRITTYFFYAYFILIPEIATYGFAKQNNKKIAMFVVVILFALYHWIYTSNANIVPDYSSYLFTTGI